MYLLSWPVSPSPCLSSFPSFLSHFIPLPLYLFFSCTNFILFDSCNHNPPPPQFFPSDLSRSSCFYRGVVAGNCGCARLADTPHAQRRRLRLQGPIDTAYQTQEGTVYNYPSLNFTTKEREAKMSVTQHGDMFRLTMTT